MAADIIERLKKSGNKLLEAEAKNLDQWRKLKHTKTDFELFLTYNIAEIRFKPEDKHDFISIICTSNNRFIKAYNIIRNEDKDKVKHFPFNGIHTKEQSSVMTYDLEDKKYKTISLKAWEIINFITITEENVFILDQLVKDCLKK